MRSEYEELHRRYDYSENIYLAGKLLSKTKTDKDIVKHISLLYQTNLYQELVENNLEVPNPEDIVNLYYKELKERREE